MDVRSELIEIQVIEVGVDRNTMPGWETPGSLIARQSAADNAATDSREGWQKIFLTAQRGTAETARPCERLDAKVRKTTTT